MSSALEACGDAAQFYRAFLKCSGKGHSVVLLDDIPSGTSASFANLTVLKRSLACGLDRVDIGGVGDAVLFALFESLALQLSADDDCTLANSIPWYILLKYVERSRGRDACSALTKFMRDDLTATKDPYQCGLRRLSSSERIRFITRSGCRARLIETHRLVGVGLVTFSKPPSRETSMPRSDRWCRTTSVKRWR